MIFRRSSPSSPPAPGGFWNYNLIIKRQAESEAANTPIISDYKVERVQPASYRLRVGPEIYVSSPVRDGKYPVRKSLKPNEASPIPPGQFAFLITEEVVHMPPDALGFVTLRLKPTKFKGIVNVSGFHVDPTYKGRLIFTIYNAGPATVQVACGDEWFELFFASLVEPITDPKYFKDKDGYMSIPSELLMQGPPLTLDMLREEMEETEERLRDRVERVERENAIQRWAVTLIVAALVAFGVKSCSDTSPRTAGNEFVTVQVDAQ